MRSHMYCVWGRGNRRTRERFPFEQALFAALLSYSEWGADFARAGKESKGRGRDVRCLPYHICTTIDGPSIDKPTKISVQEPRLLHLLGVTMAHSSGAAPLGPGTYR